MKTPLQELIERLEKKREQAELKGSSNPKQIK